jgi:hypothetical protein
MQCRLPLIGKSALLDRFKQGRVRSNWGLLQ